MILPSNMLAGISGKTATLTICAVDPRALPESAREAVGGRPVVSLAITVDGEHIEWNNPNAPVTVIIPYTPAQGEDHNAIVVWYIDGSGNLTCVTSGSYSAESKAVVFAATHFSFYAAGYNKVSYKDVPVGSWYYDAVTYLAARGITSGTGDDKYSPDASLARGQFITLLMRAYGIAPDENPTDNFIDAGNTYYTGYLAAAKRLGIASGIGDGKYAPEMQISRQDMIVLMYKTLSVLGKLPQGDAGRTLVSYSDSGEIASYAQAAVERFVKAGVLSSSGDKLNPKDIATRTEMAQILYRILTH